MLGARDHPGSAAMRVLSSCRPPSPGSGKDQSLTGRPPLMRPRSRSTQIFGPQCACCAGRGYTIADRDGRSRRESPPVGCSRARGQGALCTKHHHGPQGSAAPVPARRSMGPRQRGVNPPGRAAAFFHPRGRRVRRRLRLAQPEQCADQQGARDRHAIGRTADGRSYRRLTPAQITGVIDKRLQV